MHYRILLSPYTPIAPNTGPVSTNSNLESLRSVVFQALLSHLSLSQRGYGAHSGGVVGVWL